MATTKSKIHYLCNDCGADFPKWSGQCTECGAWNSLAEFRQPPHQQVSKSGIGYAGAQTALQPTALAQVPAADIQREAIGIAEFDRVLGGGLVQGSVILIGGDPGIGKSTLILQTTCTLATDNQVLYVTGEESLQQVSLRAQRLQLTSPSLHLLTATCIEDIMSAATQQKANILVIDSIQTMYSQALQTAPGAVGQIRESTAQLVRFAKQTHTSLFLIGHVTKDGALAGPRVLEHMVDTVLYFESQADNRFRILRTVKNRFGAVNELGVFAMTDLGLKEINNPSAIFLSHRDQQTPGSVAMVTWEGSRPLLVEIQALVDNTNNPNPKRLTLGLEQSRLSMLLAVLHRHGGVSSYDQDVFINAVGGIKISETASDLAVIAAISSSLKNHPIHAQTIIFGEVGLSGEIRPVQSGQERLKEAAKQGFTHAIIPKQNQPQKPITGLKCLGVSTIGQALSALNDMS